MADGGIYAWEPNNDEPFLTGPDGDIEAAVLQALPEHTREIVEIEGGTGKGHYITGDSI